MSRKRSNKKDVPVIQEFKKANIMPLTEMEGKYFQSLVDASNHISKVLQNKAQYEWIIKQL